MGREGKNTAIYVGFEDYEQAEMATPERNLLRAILLNAVADINRPGEFSRRARDYFMSKEDDYVFSFQSVCGFLNINPHHILILVGLEKSDRFPLLGVKGVQEVLDDSEKVAQSEEEVLSS